MHRSCRGTWKATSGAAIGQLSQPILARYLPALSRSFRYNRGHAPPTHPDSRMTRLAAFALLFAAPSLAFAQNDVPNVEKPVAVWHFNAADEPGVPKAA